MRLILNIVWLVFGGLWLALGYLLAASSASSIITIPFGFAALRIASYALWPFGRTVVDKPGPRPGALIGNVIWVILFGIWLAIGHVITAVAMAITIIGIPLALANLKLIPVSLVPLGKEIVPVDDLKNRASRRMTITELGVPSVRARAQHRPTGRCSTPWPDRHRPAGVADRSAATCGAPTACRPRARLAAGRAAADLATADPPARIAVTRLGITSVRFTGGEPLVAKHLEDVVATTAALPSSRYAR